MFACIVVLSLLSGSAHGHFLLDAPVGRGFNDATNPQPPCGGFNTSTASVDFDIQDGKITFTILDGHGVVIFNYMQTQWAEYVTLSDQEVIVTGAGDYTATIDLSAVGVLAGTTGTIQVVFESNNDNDTFDSNFYQCIDIAAMSEPSAAIALRPFSIL